MRRTLRRSPPGYAAVLTADASPAPATTGVLHPLADVVRDIAVAWHLPVLSPPVLVGWALIATGAATAVWWASRIATGRADRPPALQVAGRIGLVAAVVLGAAHLVPGVTTIVSRG